MNLFNYLDTFSKPYLRPHTLVVVLLIRSWLRCVKMDIRMLSFFYKKIVSSFTLFLRLYLGSFCGCLDPVLFCLPELLKPRSPLSELWDHIPTSKKYISKNNPTMNGNSKSVLPESIKKGKTTNNWHLTPWTRKSGELYVKKNDLFFTLFSVL